MIDDNDVEEFLSHYGVKGMKWGVRNDRRRERRAERRAAKEPLSPSQKYDRAARIMGVASIAAIGASFVLKNRQANQRKLVSSLPKPMDWDSAFQAKDSSGKIISEFKFGTPMTQENLKKLFG